MTPSSPIVHGATAQDNDHRRGLSCFDLVGEAVASEPGIVNVSLDTRREKIAFDYDPERITEPDIMRIASEVGSTLHKRWETCTMRLERQGGRACESCALALERRVGDLAGVHRATASYMGGVLSVEYDHGLTSTDELIKRVRQLGVAVTSSGQTVSAVPLEAEARPTLVRQLRAWLHTDQAEIAFSAITFAAMILGWLAHKLDLPAPVSAAFYAIAYVTGGYYGLRAGIESLRMRTIDVDLLMVLAALGAAVVGAPFEGALLLLLFSMSNVLQHFALDRTRNAIRALMRMRPDQALVRRGSRAVTLPIDQVVVGDRVVVRPGERIPLDGEIMEGETSVDQSSITGESLPVAKQPGDEVLAGTINQQGSLEVRVSKLAQDSTIARLIKLVEEAHSEKAHTQRFIDKAEQYYATGVILFTALAILVPIFALGEAFQTAFYRGMTLMVAASPCALVISTPASILSAIGNSARRGVLFKGGVYLEQAAGIKVVAFDKTGTLTLGKPQVTDVVVTDESVGGEDALLALAAAVEARSEHPLAQAIVGAAQQRGLALQEVTAFQSAAGMGARASVNGDDVFVGALRYLKPVKTTGLQPAREAIERLQLAGKTSVAVARLDERARAAHMLGALGIADVLRPDASTIVQELKDAGVEHVVMLTGDNHRVARAIASRAGVDEAYAELLPEDKVRVVKGLRTRYGAVAMVGDGVNDAPALATASLGIAMGAAGSDVALETADVVLMSDDLSKIPYAIALSRQTRRTLLVNLAFAMTMIALMIAGILLFSLPLPLAVVGHEGGTVLVSLNGLRLLAFKRKRRRARVGTQNLSDGFPKKGV